MDKGLIRAALALALCAAASASLAGEPAPFASVTPTARVEYWQKRLVEIDHTLQDQAWVRRVKLVFIGDSITDFWTMDEDLWVPGKWHGATIWNDTFTGRDPKLFGLDLGISGDRTEHILYRLLPKAKGGLGELDTPALEPDYLIIMAGINNSWAPESEEVQSIIDGVKAVVAAAHRAKPNAKIILQSLLPTPDGRKNQEVVLPVNAALEAAAANHRLDGDVVFLDLYSGFVDSSGGQIGTLFVDGLHPNREGYRIWRDRLTPTLTAR